MKHAPKPPKAFAALVIGLLGFTLASAFIFVSAAPSSVSLQPSQPSIVKVALKPMDAKGKGSLTSYNWAGKPVFVKYSEKAKTLEMFAQVANSSSKATTWYAFDSFSYVTKNLDLQKVDDFAVAQAPDAGSSLWQKARSTKMPNYALAENEYRVLVAYVTNADPKSASGVGNVDSIAYIVIEPEQITAPSAELSFTSAVDNPVAQQYVLGQVNQSIFKFNATASTAEDVKLDTVSVTFKFQGQIKGNPAGAVKFVRMFDGNKQIGTVASVLTTSNTIEPNTGYATISGLELLIPKGTSKTVSVVVDWAASDVYSGTEVTAYIANDFAQKSGSAVGAYAVKGGALKISGISSGWGKNTPMSNAATLYATKISVAHAENAPSGASSKGSEQVVARYIISNTANVNNQAAIIESMKPSIASSIKIPVGMVRMAKIYKGDKLMNANLFMAGGYKGSSFTLASPFENVLSELFIMIEAGTFQSFTMTLNTVDASANDTVIAGFEQGGIMWSDGVTKGISSVKGLPLTGKKLMY